MRLKSLMPGFERATLGQFAPCPGPCSISLRDLGNSPRPAVNELTKTIFTNLNNRRAGNEPRNAFMETICGVDLMRLWRVKGKKPSAPRAKQRLVSVEAMAAFNFPTFSDLFIIILPHPPDRRTARMR